MVEKKQTRQARRIVQRKNNITRALKMREKRIAHCKNQAKPNVLSNDYYIGCSGWFYWDWRDFFYLKTKSPSEWFDHYSGHFNTVELNAPFYSWPTLATVNTWIKQIKNKKFIYTIKVSELITHIKKFNGTKVLIKDFGFIADLLGSLMGCFLYQLPPSFKYTRSRLNKILKQLEPNRRNVIEFRHPSWWNEDVYNAFRKANVIFCSCSAPNLPDDLVKTADDIYIRFHGINKWYKHDYSKNELAVWAKRIKNSGAKRVWVYFNNDYQAHSVKNAEELIKQLTHQRGGGYQPKNTP